MQRQCISASRVARSLWMIMSSHSTFAERAEGYDCIINRTFFNGVPYYSRYQSSLMTPAPLRGPSPKGVRFPSAKSRLEISTRRSAALLALQGPRTFSARPARQLPACPGSPKRVATVSTSSPTSSERKISPSRRRDQRGRAPNRSGCSRRLHSQPPWPRSPWPPIPPCGCWSQGKHRCRA